MFIAGVAAEAIPGLGSRWLAGAGLEDREIIFSCSLLGVLVPDPPEGSPMWMSTYLCVVEILGIRGQEKRVPGPKRLEF